MPRVLSESDVADFRERLCAAAERLFAEKGPDAVTMRQLAAELGVSPMTPYRYFRDKDEILAAVRVNSFNRFADALDKALASAMGSERSKGVIMGEAYVDFALNNPHTYKVMFDLDQPHQETYPELAAAGQRSHKRMESHVKGLIEQGVLAGDPVLIARMFWAAAHGAVVLELAGKLPAGEARTLYRAMVSSMAKGLRGSS
jgi:AcrR family transcriptional regulator